MAKIVIENLSDTVLDTGTTANTLLHHIQAAGLDWMHSCGRKGRCTTCKAVVTRGGDNLGPLTPAEQRYRHVQQLAPNERLSCQAVVLGDVSIRVPDQSKLPHIRYSS